MELKTRDKIIVVVLVIVALAVILWRQISR